MASSASPSAPAADGTASSRSARPAAVIVATIVTGIVGLSLWYIVQPQPIVVQGEVDARRIDIAARVDGRVGARPVDRGQNVQPGQPLLTIDNAELVARLNEAQAARAVVAANLARIFVGTRQEVVAARRAALASAEASLRLQQQTYDRTRQLAEKDFASAQKLDETTAATSVARRGVEQARAALDEALAGNTVEERRVAEANVAKADAAIATLKAQVEELGVTAPTAAQVYQIGVEVGEYVSPGVPLLSLVDLADMWLRFDLREDLAGQLKIGDRVAVRIPALGDTLVPVEIRSIATRGEYAGWRATRATGDFDMRSFEVRAYPVDHVSLLRPGMSAYVDLRGGR